MARGCCSIATSSTNGFEPAAQPDRERGHEPQDGSYGHISDDARVGYDQLSARRVAYSRGWQRCRIAEITETDTDDVARWKAGDLERLEPHHRRAVEALLSVDGTLPWWTRAHA